MRKISGLAKKRFIENIMAVEVVERIEIVKNIDTLQNDGTIGFAEKIGSKIF